MDPPNTQQLKKLTFLGSGPPTARSDHFSDKGLLLTHKLWMQTRREESPLVIFIPEGGDFCAACERLVKAVPKDDQGELTHSPGMLALTRSAIKCSLCAYLEGSLGLKLFPELAELLKLVETGALIDEQKIKDDIFIFNFSRDITNPEYIRWFKVNWKNLDHNRFVWWGDLIGIYVLPQGK
jgi:hypothetical protein